uniref:BHLH domain-containing protein n=1 Tax=Peronospora matthiolae TaxID=2874970 RepID=A0AAV1TM86_9STRA
MSSVFSSPRSAVPRGGRARLFPPRAMPGAYNSLMHTRSKHEPGVPYFHAPSSALRMAPSSSSPSAYGLTTTPTPQATISTNPSSASILTPSNSSHGSNSSGAKRSREDLNQKEKQRMLKLNDRISQLKKLLDDAGVQTKKNKQSILDNTSQYIETLRGDLAIAQQKADQAEKQTETLRQTQKRGKTDHVISDTFQKTTTPRVVLDMDMKTVVFNTAFVNFTGLSELALKRKKTLRPFLCTDTATFERMMKNVRETRQSTSAVVRTAVGSHVVLVAAVVTDDDGNVPNVEFCLIPIEMEE